MINVIDTFLWFHMEDLYIQFLMNLLILSYVFFICMWCHGSLNLQYHSDTHTCAYLYDQWSALGGMQKCKNTETACA